MSRKERRQQLQQQTHSTPERAANDTTVSIEPVKSKLVFATVCQANPNHLHTRVYAQRGRKRYCVCDDCGATWAQVAEPLPEVPTSIPADRALE